MVYEFAAYGVTHTDHLPGAFFKFLPTLTIPTIQTSHTPIHLDHRLGAALATKLRAGRKITLGLCLLIGGFILRPLLRHQLLLMFIQLVILDQANKLEVTLNGITQLGDQ